MKILKIFFYCCLLFFATGCNKDNSETILAEIQDPNKSKLKIIYASAYLIRDSIQIKINDERVSNTFMGNTTTTFLATPFPGGGLNTGGDSRPNYLNVNPGNTKIFISVPKKNSNIDSIIRFSGYANLDAGMYYSAYITDTLLNANMVLVKENMAAVDPGKSRFKYVNLIPNLSAIDLYFGGIVVAANVPYKSVSNEFVLNASDTGHFEIRAAGAPRTVLPVASYPTTTGTYSIPDQRVMTVFAKGYNAGSAARTPILALLFNK